MTFFFMAEAGYSNSCMSEHVGMVLYLITIQFCLSYLPFSFKIREEPESPPSILEVWTPFFLPKPQITGLLWPFLGSLHTVGAD